VKRRETSAVFEACDLAAEGCVADGYQVLLIGKLRALEGEQNFEPCGDSPVLHAQFPAPRPILSLPTCGVAVSCAGYAGARYAIASSGVSIRLLPA
jgi:hypothetical protein